MLSIIAATTNMASTVHGNVIIQAKPTTALLCSCHTYRFGSLITAVAVKPSLTKII
jgi:hypothetical protein